MKRAIVVARQSAHQIIWGGSFANGLRRHGWQVSLQDAHPGPCDMLVLWSVRNQLAIKAQKRAGGEVCILERGYVGDRSSWTSVSFGGGLNNRGEFRGPFHDGSRWKRYFSRLMKPWQRRDGYALLIGQVPGDMSIAGVDIDGWYRRTASELKSIGLEVRFRPHPVAVQSGRASEVPGVPTIGGDLDRAIVGAAVVVTFNSNTAVEAVLAGCPSIALDRGSMAWPVVGHQLSDIITPDRAAWANRLAWCQFSLDEMRSGACWEAVSCLSHEPGPHCGVRPCSADAYA